MISAALRVSARRSVLRTIPKRGLNISQRAYSTPSQTTTTSSTTPWAIGSLLVFGPILFKLTSPPPKQKHVHEPIQQPVEQERKEENVEEEKKEVSSTTSAKKIQKPYVLVGAGTASFAAAQAIKELEPEANVKLCK